MNKSIILSIVVAFVIIGGAFLVSTSNNSGPGDSSTVSIENGTQIIGVLAKNGYSPQVIAAEAGMPTTLRVQTDGTYDCSASLTVPALSYRKLLPPTGTEDIAIAADQAHGTLNAVCGMGMKSFKIKFN
jgi:plastocyanin domain-containing protein